MKSRNLIIGTGALIAIGLLASAFSLKTKRTIPEGAHAVTPFDADKYLGTWYEIARFDFKFEKGLSKTTANYSLNDDGSIHVINRGYDAKKGKWKESVGKAVFVEEPDEAMLKVHVAAFARKDYARKSEGQIPRNRQGYRLRHLQTGVGGTVTGPRSPVIRRKDGSTLPSFLRIPLAAME